MKETAYDPQQVTATGNLVAGPVVYGYLILTGAAVAATATIRKGGVGGTIIATLSCGANGWAGIEAPAFIIDAHVTLAGAGAVLNFGS